MMIGHLFHQKYYKKQSRLNKQIKILLFKIIQSSQQIPKSIVTKNNRIKPLH
jgi:hypothetical protein